ncbi:MAG TPA: AmmeMemoRadiSam system protein B [Alphaproteobacteria bacterium]|nr:AmmeMemoRadiSam system protein B [Alphaproteobacteria bacterium]
MPAIRAPAVAGTFYPDDPVELRDVLARLLDAALEPRGQAPKAVIVPHAGYVYSGAVAAHGYRALGRDAALIRRVVLIGPAHYVPLDGAALPAADAFLTPLGPVPLDGAECEALAARPGVVRSDRAHAEEHALEVQLPFLQATLRDFAIVPLLVGEARHQDVADWLDVVWGGEETRIVVSSDLSHYHSYETARRRDAATARAIETSDFARIGAEDACGATPIAGLLAVARRRGLAVRRLDLRNSGDTAGPRGRVVGYGAWAFA